MSNEMLSRVQLLLRSDGDSLVLENRGRPKLSVNGVEVERASVVPGDVVELGKQLVLFAVCRPTTLRGEAPADTHAFGRADAHGLVGESPAIWALRAEIAFLGPRAGHVMVLGPSGTGKELVAQAIHASSGRRGRPLVSRNAATIPDGLVDAELFGNLRGYPNPSMPERPGLVGAAHGSTLFLDEFAELAHSAQAHLLRVLDGGEYQRLGESEVRRADLRLIAATNRPPSTLKQDVAARFLLRLHVPLLDDRLEDIPLLLENLVRLIAASDPDAAARFIAPSGAARLSPSWVASLLRRRYSTNVRELQALLWEAIARSSGDVLGQGVAAHSASPPGGQAAPSWPPLSGSPASSSAPGSSGSPSSPPGPVSEPEADDGAPSLARVRRCLEEHNGNLEETWKALGLPNRYVLRRLIQKHRLEVTRRAK